MYLTFQKELRSSSDPAEIAILKRKGWVQTVSPAYNSSTHYPPMWRDGKWVSGDPIPPEPPIVVSMRSFRLACGRSLMIQINAAIAAIEDVDQKWQAQQFLTTSLTVSRVHPLVTSLSQAIDKSNDEVDLIFSNAKLLDDSL